MSSVILNGDTSGSVTLSAPAVAGSSTQTLAAVTGTLAPIVSGTAVSASGTSVDFTSIPSWVKRVTILFSGVSVNGSARLLVQIGTSGGIESTSYTASSAQARDATSTIAESTTNGFVIYQGNAAASAFYGSARIEAMGSNLWIFSASGSTSNASSGISSGGSKTLSGTLDRIRITSTSGTDTFDAGSINILYE